MKRILVTGADGLLGSNLVRELLKRSYDVRAFVQPGRQQKTLDGLAIEKVSGSLLSAEEIQSAAEGCRYIIHTAAITSIWPSRSEHIKKVNFDGTKNVISAALRHQVERMVYVGTASSFGFGTKQNPGHEGNPYTSAKYGLDYMDSKYKAQQAVLNAVRENHLPAVIVNPTFMLGPYDSKPGSGAMVWAIHNKKVKGYTTGGRNYICARDAAVGIANALSMGRIGECYILGHQNLSYKEVFIKIAKTIGTTPPRLYVPSTIARTFGLIGTAFARLSGTEPGFSYAMAQIASDEHYFSPAKAVKELDLPQTPLEVGIKECFDWLKEHGHSGTN